MTSTPTRRRTLAAQVVARAIAGRLPGAVVDETRVTIEHGVHAWTGTPDGLAFHIADALHPPRPGSSKAPVPVADLHGWLRVVAATLQDGETLAPGDVQTIYACRFHAILGRSDARAALYALRDEGLLVADDSDPARRVYRRTMPHTVTEKTTPAPAGTAVTPGPSTAEVRLQQYADRPGSTFGSATEKALFEIAVGLRTELQTARLQLAAGIGDQVFRAEHESFPVGLYKKQASAVAHIAHLLVQEEGPAVRERIVWSDPEDPDEAVPVWDVALRDPSTGDLVPTAYMVTALPVADEFVASEAGR
ncbi:hypothetical protein [Streptomyces corynorhini]|uniref:Uncharacterized protein n=1 Tax=Streptomyces corynorhini TaxID=2282652 RepID=A0A370B2S6_9ACTN|nr:hypothetical protein [Streptomyces corynorhini]RDG34669.1 hypothetical protein DVH02_29350 [Streptomyces corynorhini]